MEKTAMTETGQMKEEPEGEPRVFTMVNLSRTVYHSISNMAAQAVEYLVKQQHDYAYYHGFMHSEISQQIVGWKKFFENGMVFLPVISRGNEEVVSGCIRKFRILPEGKDIA